MMNTKRDEQKPQTQLDKAIHTLKTDERYSNMARSCGITTTYQQDEKLEDYQERELTLYLKGA